MTGLRPSTGARQPAGSAASPDLEPLPGETTTTLIVQRLRAAVTRGTLRPGAQLAEWDIARRLGVGRGPLREAMQRLVQEGLLQSVRNRGVFVVSLDPDDVHDIYLARLAIEQAAAHHIVDGARAAFAAMDMRPALEAMRAAAQRHDGARLTDADQQFHAALVSASGSPRLQRMADTLLAETRMCMVALENRYELPQTSVEEHRAILDALLDGDLDTALAAIRSHMRTGLQLLLPSTDE
jgi:DNA-binding GntR family transcriptional regulator